MESKFAMLGIKNPVLKILWNKKTFVCKSKTLCSKSKELLLGIKKNPCLESKTLCLEFFKNPSQKSENLMILGALKSWILRRHIFFCPNPPLFTYIGGPKGETLHLSIESSILGSLHSFNFFLGWANQSGSLQKKESWTCEPPPTN